MFFNRTNRPFVVAGPCSVESREQLRNATETLGGLRAVDLIRAGVWKPRTRPGGFEGLGKPALEWMHELAKEHNVHFCCEVARSEQVELCLQYGIEAVWLGARTTTNPFMVDELCTALRGTGLAVMVKNPVCPDVRLWTGAFERLQKAGIVDLAAVHRGFNMYDNGGYRNAPLWEVALELRRELPEVPILIDPSHIGGRANLVAPLAHTARMLDYDGLMVEVHPSPSEALTDAAQQITPEAFEALVADWLAMPTANLSEASHLLAPLRDQIDLLDRELLSLIAKRMAVSRRIASIKHDAHLPVYQQARWADVMADRLRLAAELGLDEHFIKKLLESIHAESVRVQM